MRTEDVRRCVEASAARHQSARVRTYLSILIERTATELLTTELHTVDCAELVDLRIRTVLAACSDEDHHRSPAGEAPVAQQLALTEPAVGP